MEKLLHSLRVEYIFVQRMAMNVLGERLTLQKNVKYGDLLKKWSAISVPRTVPEMCLIRSAVGKLNKIVD